VWFDIERASPVRLEIYDLRGLLVRRLLPTAARRSDCRRALRTPTTATAGVATSASSGTAPTAPVAPYRRVYLLRFRADGVEEVKKILFRGR
jgi:hypothetical protein